MRFYLKIFFINIIATFLFSDTVEYTKKQLNNSAVTLTVGSLQSKNRTSADYICVGADDDVQIQAAIDKIYSLPATGSTIGGAGGKGQIILLEGTYIIGTSIKLKPGINIKGMGTTSTVLKAKTNFNSTLMVFNEPTINPSVAVLLENLYFDGNMTNQSSTSSAIDSKTGTIALWDLHVFRCSFFDFKGEVITIDDPWGFVLNECVIEDSASSAITVTGATKTTGVSITNNKIIQTGVSTATHAITLSGCTGCRIDNNEINGYGSGSGIKILNGGGNIVTSNYLGGNTYGNGLDITTSNLNIISSNSFMLNLSGLTVTSGSNNIITNNIFSSITNLEIADAATATYIFGNRGDDTATNNDNSVNSNSGLLTANNTYAFKAQTAPLAGMFFNATNTSLDVKDTSGVGKTQFSLDGQIRSGLGTKCDGYVVMPAKEIGTTDATLTAIATIPILDDNTYNFEAAVVGVKSDGTQRASYKILCTAYRTGTGNATLQGLSTALYTSESDAAWDAVFAVVGDTNLYVGVTGKDATNIAWGCVVKYINNSN